MRIGRRNEHRFLRHLGLRVPSVGREVGDLALEDEEQPAFAPLEFGKGQGFAPPVRKFCMESELCYFSHF